MKRRLLLGSGLAAGVAGLGAGWWRLRQGGGDADALWALRAEQPGGGELVLAQWRGRPLIVNFWATWCPPCVKELPALDAFHRDQGDGGWRVIALAIDTLPQVREFIARIPLSVPVGVVGLGGTQLMGELGNVQGGLPFTVLVTRRGEVAWRKRGETNRPELERVISALS